MKQSPAEKHLKDEIFRLKEEINRQKQVLLKLEYACILTGEKRESAIEFQKGLIKKKKNTLKEKEEKLAGLSKK